MVQATYLCGHPVVKAVDVDGGSYVSMWALSGGGWCELQKEGDLEGVEHADATEALGVVGGAEKADGAEVHDNLTNFHCGTNFRCGANEVELVDHLAVFAQVEIETKT